MPLSAASSPFDSNPMSDDNLNDFSCFDWLTPTDELYSSIGEPPMAPPLLTTVSQAPIINDLNTTTFGPPPVIWLNSFWTRCDGGEERTGVCTRIEPKFTGSTFNLMIGSYAVPDQLSPDTQFKFTTPPFSATLYQDLRVPLFLVVAGGAGFYHVPLINPAGLAALLEYYRLRTRPLHHTLCSPSRRLTNACYSSTRCTASDDVMRMLVLPSTDPASIGNSPMTLSSFTSSTTSSTDSSSSTTSSTTSGTNSTGGSSSPSNFAAMYQSSRELRKPCYTTIVSSTTQSPFTGRTDVITSLRNGVPVPLRASQMEWTSLHFAILAKSSIPFVEEACNEVASAGTLLKRDILGYTALDYAIACRNRQAARIIGKAMCEKAGARTKTDDGEDVAQVIEKAIDLYSPHSSIRTSASSRCIVH